LATAATTPAATAVITTAFATALATALATITAFAAALTVLQPLEGAAQFVKLAFVAGFLNLRDLQHFENVFHRRERFLQGTDDLLDVANGLVNRRTLRALRLWLRLRWLRAANFGRPLGRVLRTRCQACRRNGRGRQWSAGRRAGSSGRSRHGDRFGRVLGVRRLAGEAGDFIGQCGMHHGRFIVNCLRFVVS
jgi:hypothetical protein